MKWTSWPNNLTLALLVSPWQRRTGLRSYISYVLLYKKSSDTTYYHVDLDYFYLKEVSGFTVTNLYILDTIYVYILIKQNIIILNMKHTVLVSWIL